MLLKDHKVVLVLVGVLLLNVSAQWLRKCILGWMVECLGLKPWCINNIFVRDIEYLEDYKIDKLEVFDQFSNTPHLELIALISKI